MLPWTTATPTLRCDRRPACSSACHPPAFFTKLNTATAEMIRMVIKNTILLVQARVFSGDGCVCGMTLMKAPQCGHMLGATGASDLQIGHCIAEIACHSFERPAKHECHSIVPGVTGPRLIRKNYSRVAGCNPMFFSPAAFFSLYFFIQASQLFPAAVSLPVKARAAMSA